MATKASLLCGANKHDQRCRAYRLRYLSARHEHDGGTAGSPLLAANHSPTTAMLSGVQLVESSVRKQVTTLAVKV